MKKKTVYIETSIISYLSARPTSDLLAAAWQKITSDWWDTQSSRFSLYTSAVVTEEAGRGNPNAASRRLNALSGIPLLAITEEVIALSKALLQEGALPAKALDDSLHIALAAVHGVDYLLTWNCRHIDNAEMKPVVRKVCGRAWLCVPRDWHSARTYGGKRKWLTKSSKSCGKSKTTSPVNTLTT